MLPNSTGGFISENEPFNSKNEKPGPCAVTQFPLL